MFIGHYEPEVAKATTFLLNPASRRSVDACRAGFSGTSGQLFIRRSRFIAPASLAGVRRGPR